MSSKSDTLKMTMTPEFQARAMVHVARQDDAGAEAMERDLVALINTKNDLLAALKEMTERYAALDARLVAGQHSEPNGTIARARSAIARAEGGEA